MPWLVNPPRKRKKKARKATARKRRKGTSRNRRGVPQWVKDKGFSSWSAYMASIRPNPGKGRTMASRRKRSRRRPTRRRRRTYRRNPPLVRGAIKTLVNGAQGAAIAVGGKVGARMIRNLLPLEDTGIMGVAKSALSAVAVGIAADKVLPARFRDAAVIGALMAPVEDVASSLNLPFLNAGLASYPVIPAGRSLGAIPAPPVRMLASYPEAGMDDFEYSSGGAAGLMV